MPFNTYPALQAAVASWLHRTDLTAAIPDFISLAETDFNRRLNITAKELEASVPLASGARSAPLPADFASPVALWNEYVQPRFELPAVTAAELPRNTARSAPCLWAIDGANMIFDCAADQNYPLTLRYIQSLHIADSPDGTSTMLTKYPDLFLYGALAQSAPYLRDDARVALWAGNYEKLIAGIKSEASRSKGIATLRTDIPNYRSRSFNINRGY